MFEIVFKQLLEKYNCKKVFKNMRLTPIIAKCLKTWTSINQEEFVNCQLEGKTSIAYVIGDVEFERAVENIVVSEESKHWDIDSCRNNQVSHQNHKKHHKLNLQDLATQEVEQKNQHYVGKLEKTTTDGQTSFCQSVGPDQETLT